MKTNALTQLTAKNLPHGKHADGRGLWLVKSRKDAGKWMLRIVVGGKRREMGLGQWPEVTIAEAREHASKARKQVRAGFDPIQERHKQKHQTTAMTVQQAVDASLKAKQAELKNDGQAGRWLSPLKIHVLPKIGNDPIEGVDQHTIVRVLEPIWHEKADTARKAMNRLNLTLKHAAAFGLDVDLQAVLKARALLGKQRHKTVHVPSLPYQDCPAFYQMLCEQPFDSCLALRFLMLTLARTSEIRFATHTDINDDLWIIPAERTKTNTEHRIPLTAEALRVIKLAKTQKRQTLLFPSPTGKVMSDATMSRFMERGGYEARPHGFRSSFRSWAEECTDAPHAVKELSLGHKVGSDVERAYQRSDLLTKRRILLNMWADFITTSKA